MRDAREPALEIRLTAAAVGAVALLAPFGLIAFLVVRNVGWLHRFDLAVTDALHRYVAMHPGWVHFLNACSTIFAPLTWRVAAALVVLWLLRRRAWPLACWVAVTMTAGGMLGALLKLLVGRHRPALLDPVAQAPGYSFPSGHALNSALGAVVLLLVLRPLVPRRPAPRGVLWLAAVAIPLVTGISRIALGVHWTSDVVAGWLLGVAVPVVTAMALLTWQGRRTDEFRVRGRSDSRRPLIRREVP